MTRPVASGSGPATARALAVTAGGGAAADAVGRLRAGVPRPLTWRPALVSLVPPAAALTAPTPGFDLLGAVVDRVGGVIAADDGPGLHRAPNRTRPAPSRDAAPGRRAVTGPDTVRPAAHASSVGTATPSPRRHVDAAVMIGVADDDRTHPFDSPRLDASRWTRGLHGRPLGHGSASTPVETTSAPGGARSMVSPPRLARAAAGPGAIAGAAASAPTSTEQGAPVSAPGPLSADPAARPPGAAPVTAGGAPASRPGATGSAVQDGAPPSARAAAGRVAGGLRDLVQRWADPVSASPPPTVPGPADPPARPPTTIPVTTDAAADGGSLESRPAGPVDLLELGDALDELLAQEAETHGLDGRVL